MGFIALQLCDKLQWEEWHHKLLLQIGKVAFLALSLTNTLNEKITKQNITRFIPCARCLASEHYLHVEFTRPSLV